MDINRRNFLKGALVTGAAAAAAVALPACSPAASSDASDAKSSSKGGETTGAQHPWEVAPEPIADIAETQDFDVVVVGAGLAGINATEAAARNGAKTVVIERNTTFSVRGVDDMMVRIAHCCNPVPGDSIVGFISRGRGVIVHTATCPNIQEMEPDRLVSVQWDGHETQPFPVRIHIMARNQKGSLADIAIVLRDEDVNIDGCLLQALVDGRSEMEMVVQVRDVAHLYHVIDRLRHLPSVMEVLRKTANEE